MCRLTIHVPGYANHHELVGLFNPSGPADRFLNQPGNDWPLGQRFPRDRQSLTRLKVSNRHYSRVTIEPTIES